MLIRRHLDLNSVRARLDEGAYSSSSEFFRDLLLIFNNGMVYYSHESVQFRGAKALFTEATKEMNRIFQTEALLKQDRPSTQTREVKIPKAFARGAPPGKVLTLSTGPASSAKLAGTISLLTSLPDSCSKTRASSRLGLTESPSNSHSEGGAPHSANVSFHGDPSSSRAEETGNSSNESTSARIPGVPTQAVVEESMADYEAAKKRGAEKETMRRKGIDEIHGDDGLLCKGKRLSKLLDLDGTPDRGPEVKPHVKSRPTAAARVASNSHITVSQNVRRLSRGVRKLVTPAQEPVRPSEPQAKKRMRRCCDALECP